MAIDEFDRAIIARFLFEESTRLDSDPRIRGYPLIDVGNGRQASTQLLLQCYRGHGRGFDPVAWVCHAIDLVGGDVEQLRPAAIEYWRRRGGIPADLIEF